MDAAMILHNLEKLLGNQKLIIDGLKVLGAFENQKPTSVTVSSIESGLTQALEDQEVIKAGILYLLEWKSSSGSNHVDKANSDEFEIPNNSTNARANITNHSIDVSEEDFI